jgi:hypothetical protein
MLLQPVLEVAGNNREELIMRSVGVAQNLIRRLLYLLESRCPASLDFKD